MLGSSSMSPSVIWTAWSEEKCRGVGGRKLLACEAAVVPDLGEVCSQEYPKLAAESELIFWRSMLDARVAEDKSDVAAKNSFDLSEKFCPTC